MLPRYRAWISAFVLGLITVAACGPGTDESTPTRTGVVPASTNRGAEAPTVPESAESLTNTSQLSQQLRVNETWLGDLDGMVARRRLRMLVAYNRTNYFIDDQGNQRGITYEAGEQFEDFLRKRFGLPRGAFNILFIPVSRDEILERLLDGRGDIAAANLSITAAREKVLDFGTPAISGVREILVTGPGFGEIDEVEDLAGRVVHVRRKSSYFESLEALNRRLAVEGLEPVDIRLLDEHLETEDVLELIASGALPASVADSHMLELWADVMPQLRVHEDIVLRDDVEIAWAIRQGSPDLKAAIDEFGKTHKKGTLLGNLLYKRYLQDNRWVRNPVAAADQERFHGMRALFQRYGDQYGFSDLYLAAQGYQESGLDQSKRSRAGAIGVMQLMQTTASSDEVGIPNVDDLELNIHAGAKYMRVLADRYFNDSGLDDDERHLFALAAYNAGPTRIRRMRRLAERQGYDPDRWFDNVELVTARHAGREPVTYVRNVYKYYVSYRLVEERASNRILAKQPHR